MLYAVDDHPNGSGSSFNFHGMPQKYAVSVAKYTHLVLISNLSSSSFFATSRSYVAEVPATKVQTPIEKNPLKE